jgi:hypothetical protein
MDGIGSGEIQGVLRDGHLVIQLQVITQLSGGWLDPDQCLLVVVVSARTAADTRTAGIQCIAGKIAVIISAPSPVEMKEVVAVVPVTDKCMSARSEPGIFNGSPGIQFVFQQCVPRGIRIIGPLDTPDGSIVIEVFLQGILDAVLDGLRSMIT